MKLHHTQYKKNYINYILEENEITPEELKERFHNEYGHLIQKMASVEPVKNG